MTQFFDINNLIVIAVATLPIWGTFLWQLWQGVVKPGLISEKEIDLIARKMIDCHGLKATENAFIKEDRAWRYSESFEQGKWRRVRQRIKRLTS